MNNVLAAEVRKDLEVVFGAVEGVYVDAAHTITFVVDRLRVEDLDALAFWFCTTRINFCRGQDMTTAGAAGYEIEIRGALLQ